MKTIEAELKLFRSFDFRQKLIVTNVTNNSNLPIYFETDMVVMTGANYVTGIEIKVSKSDLKNDLKKRHVVRSGFQNNFNHYYKAFKHFCYAVPEELLEECEKQVDDRFGIINLSKTKYNTVNYYRSPVFLHNYKWTDKQRYELSRLGAMRVYNLKQKIKKLEKI